MFPIAAYYQASEVAAVRERTSRSWRAVRGRRRHHHRRRAAAID